MLQADIIEVSSNALESLLFYIYFSWQAGKMYK